MKIRPLLLLPALALCAAVSVPARAAEDTPPRKTVITSKGRAEFQSSETETTFIFNQLVTVEATGLDMTCDRLEVVALRPAKRLKELGDKKLADADKFKSLLATGRVRIVQGNRVATCGRAEVLPGENKIVLSDNPMVVVDDGFPVTGDRIIMLKDQQQVIVEGPARIEGPAIKDLGAKKEKPAEKKP